ncbi:tyrosine-type recombinase/integrase [Alkalispirochaeta alkalica]|uniref:tyrosine-type recombinase/integrase n=1 Tax=Alkalispirochaeta alkalica TaxID=46356 RepID=UPI000476B928|nr:tyrosine-type recombinase/integrase [Alkalispirochaeta alkalica]
MKPPVDSSRITLGKYADGFFDWPDGRYATDRRAGGHRVSHRSAQSHRTDCRNHVLRILGAGTPIADITRQETRRLRDTLFGEGKAATTINHVINTLSVLLQAAEEDEIIQAVPRLYRAGGGTKKRGSLTREEARDLLATDGAWRNDRERIASEIAARTGLRRSELLGLTADRCHRDYIDVSRVWEPVSWELKETTKGGEARIVPISRRIRSLIVYLLRSSPYRWNLPPSQQYVFYHDTNPRAPYDGRELTRGLYHALEHVGMSEEQRQAAGITFHSWRHFANSQMIEAGIPEATVRALIGHQSQAMTMNYYHAQDLARIAAVQDDW